jgi:hypothetical protein
MHRWILLGLLVVAGGAGLLVVAGGAAAEIVAMAQTSGTNVASGFQLGVEFEGPADELFLWVDHTITWQDSSAGVWRTFATLNGTNVDCEWHHRMVTSTVTTLLSTPYAGIRCELPPVGAGTHNVSIFRFVDTGTPPTPLAQSLSFELQRQNMEPNMLLEFLAVAAPLLIFFGLYLLAVFHGPVLLNIYAAGFGALALFASWDDIGGFRFVIVALILHVIVSGIADALQGRRAIV